MDGHPLILGRPWLATADAYIGCQEGNMTIAKGDVVKKIVLYPPAKLSLPVVKICKQLLMSLEESIHSQLIVAESLDFKDQTKHNVIVIL